MHSVFWSRFHSDGNSAVGGRICCSRTIDEQYDIVLIRHLKLNTVDQRLQMDL